MPRSGSPDGKSGAKVRIDAPVSIPVRNCRRRAGLRQRDESGDGGALYALDLGTSPRSAALPNDGIVYALEPAKAPDGVDVAAVSRY